MANRRYPRYYRISNLPTKRHALMVAGLMASRHYSVQVMNMSHPKKHLFKVRLNLWDINHSSGVPQGLNNKVAEILEKAESFDEFSTMITELYS